MTEWRVGTYLGAAGAGGVLAVVVLLAGTVQGSAAHLEVDGGVLQEFHFDGPHADLLQVESYAEPATEPSLLEDSIEPHAADDPDETNTKPGDGEGEAEPLTHADDDGGTDPAKSQNTPVTNDPAKPLDDDQAAESTAPASGDATPSQGNSVKKPVCPDGAEAEDQKSCAEPQQPALNQPASMTAD